MEKTRIKLKKLYSTGMITTIGAILLYLVVVLFKLESPSLFFQFLMILASLMLVIGIVLWAILAYQAIKANREYDTKEFNVYMRPIQFGIIYIIIHLMLSIF